MSSLLQRHTPLSVVKNLPTASSCWAGGLTIALHLQVALHETGLFALALHSLLLLASLLFLRKSALLLEVGLGVAFLTGNTLLAGVLLTALVLAALTRLAR